MRVSLRNLRFFWLVVHELAKKYTKALVFGLVLGAVGSFLSLRFGRPLVEQWFFPIDRIGIVGDYTPTTLPSAIQSHISMGLTTIGPDGQALPGLADHWEATTSGKAMTYTFYLRTDVHWHDGTVARASDINYNIKNVSFTPLSDSKIQVTLDDPYSPFPVLVAKPLLKAGLIGLGSYKVEGIVLQGDAIRYLRIVPVEKSNQKPKEYRFYKTESQAITAYKMGDIDELENISSLSVLAHWGNAKIHEDTQYDRMVSLFFNTKDGELSDKTFRQALGHAVPEISYERAYSPISKVSWAHVDNVRRYGLSDDQARKLLKNTKEGSASAELVMSTFAPFLDVAEKIAAHWRDLGVPVKVQVQSGMPQTFQILLAAQTLSPDPDQYPFWHSTQTKGNISGYANVKIDKLLEDGRKELDMEKRKKLYADFQRRLVDDAPAIFLYYPKVYSVVRGK